MIQQITVKQLAERLAAGEKFYLLDVRQPAEYQLAALPGSKLIPLGELPTRGAEIEVPADASLVVYCHHGVRSIHGAMYLEQQGFSPVYSLAGGIDAWSREVDAGVPRY